MGLKTLSFSKAGNFGGCLQLVPDCAVRDFSPLELNRSLLDFVFEVFSVILHWLRKWTKKIIVNGCQTKSFCLGELIYHHKQQFTMLHLWYKLQACILYWEKVILLFRPVMLIRVYCKRKAWHDYLIAWNFILHTRALLIGGISALLCVNCLFLTLTICKPGMVFNSATATLHQHWKVWFLSNNYLNGLNLIILVVFQNSIILWHLKGEEIIRWTTMFK
jgi:hypothetical protein